MSTEQLIKIFGAKAAVHVRFSGELRSLASKLAAGLMLPEFSIQPREAPPHDEIGSVEALGWEVWLEKSDAVQSFQYTLKMETTHSLEESFHDQMHDLSPWLARYVSSICKTETLISGTQIVFSRGNPERLD